VQKLLLSTLGTTVEVAALRDFAWDAAPSIYVLLSYSNIAAFLVVRPTNSLHLPQSLLDQSEHNVSVIVGSFWIHCH